MSSSTDAQESNTQNQDPQWHTTTRQQLTVGIEVEGAIIVAFNNNDVPNENLQPTNLDPDPIKLNVANKKEITELEGKVYRNIQLIVKNIRPFLKGFELVPLRYEHAGAGTGPLDTGKHLGRLGRDNIWELYLKNWGFTIDGSGLENSFKMEKIRLDPFEITSNVYKDEHLDKLYKHLAQLLYILAKKYRVTVKGGKGDKRPDVHIHIGNPGTFELKQLKRVVTLFWIYEPAIMSLHASWRSDYIRYGSLLRKHTFLALFANTKVPVPHDPKKQGTLTANGFKFDLSTEDGLKAQAEFNANIPTLLREQDEDKGSNQKKNLKDDETPKEKEALGYIWAAADNDYLAGLTASRFGLRRPALSFFNLASDTTPHINHTREKGLQTIEFRHMQGSFVADDIGNWITVVHKLVDICVNYTDERFKSFVEQSWKNVGKDDRQTFLEAIGLGHLKFKSQEQLDKETALPKNSKAGEDFSVDFRQLKRPHGEEDDETED